MIDWSYIKALYTQGSTAYQISRQLGGKPTKQGIQQRANREEWTRAEHRTLPIVASALNIDASKLTDEVLSTVLGMISEGSTIEIACQASGITAKTWHTWCTQDPRLKDATIRARAGKIANWMNHVDKATEKDWKAATWLLQNSPDTRKDFGAQPKDSKLEVVINIDRSEGIVIEGESEPV